MEMPAENYRTTGQAGPTTPVGNGATHSNRSMLDLFTQLVDQMSLLFRKELELAKAEMSEKASMVGSGVAKMAIGGVLMIPALVAFVHAIAAWLDRLGLEPRWGYLVVGVVLALVGYLMLRSGMNATKPENLTPRRTAHQLQRDAEVAKEQVR